MKNRPRSILTCVALLSFGHILSAEAEPSYEGKPASYWIQAIGSNDQTVRSEAATALRFLGLEATGDERQQLRASVPDLLTALKEPDETLRVRAAMALGNIDPAAAIEPMLQALSDSSLNMRITAAYVLARAGRPVVPALVDALKSDDLKVRVGAASALSDIGSEATPAVPALKEALKDPDPRVKLGAALALQRIEGKLPEPEEYGH